MVIKENMKTKYIIEAECDYPPCKCDCCEDGQHMAVITVTDGAFHEFQCDECGQWIDYGVKL